MRKFIVIIVCSIGLVSLISVSGAGPEIMKGPRMARSVAIRDAQVRIQQSRVRVDALRAALLQQKAGLAAQSERGGQRARPSRYRVALVSI